jgi:hypothetical protein
LAERDGIFKGGEKILMLFDIKEAKLLATIWVFNVKNDYKGITGFFLLRFDFFYA